MTNSTKFFLSRGIVQNTLRSSTFFAMFSPKRKRINYINSKCSPKLMQYLWVLADAMRTRRVALTRVFIKTRSARPGKVGCNYRRRASGDGHFGHGCCHSHVKHNAPGYHYRCVTPPKKGDDVRRGTRKKGGAGESAARSQELPGRRCRCHCPRLQRT